MKKRYVQLTVAGVIVALVASVGVYRTVLKPTNDGTNPTGEQRIRTPDEKPMITAPGVNTKEPERQVDNRQPGGGSP